MNEESVKIKKVLYKKEKLFYNSSIVNKDEQDFKMEIILAPLLIPIMIVLAILIMLFGLSIFVMFLPVIILFAIASVFFSISPVVLIAIAVIYFIFKKA